MPNESIAYSTGPVERDSNMNTYLKKQKKGAKVPMPMKKMVIDNIIYPVQTKRGLKWGKQNKKQNYAIDVRANKPPQKLGLLLDGFLILYSCRVRLPHEAIKSKLNSKQIVDVIEEDLCYF